jgi:hypothetical protein
MIVIGYGIGFWYFVARRVTVDSGIGRYPGALTDFMDGRRVKVASL